MKWKPDLNLTTNARVFTAVYVGALVMGPPMVMHGGYGYPRAISICLWPVLPLLGGFLAGIAAGKGHGIRAAVVAYLLSRSAGMASALFDAGVHSRMAECFFSGLVLVAIVASVIGLAGWYGERVSTNIWPADRAKHGRRWRLVGLALLVLFVHTHTLGARLVVALHGHHGNDVWKVFPAGVYTGLNYGGLECSQFGDIYYADPTGLFVIGRYIAPRF